MAAGVQKQEALKSSSDTHKEMRAKINKLRDSFQACITANENMPEDEKLSRQV